MSRKLRVGVGHLTREENTKEHSRLRPRHVTLIVSRQKASFEKGGLEKATPLNLELALLKTKRKSRFTIGDNTLSPVKPVAKKARWRETL